MTSVDPQARQRTLISGFHFSRVPGDESEILEPAIMQAVNPAMHGEAAVARPGVLHDRRLADVARLFDDVQLAEPVECGFRRQRFQRMVVSLADVVDVSEPVVDESKPSAIKNRAHTAAPVMARDDHMCHLEPIHGLVQHRNAIQIGVNDHVGDVSMNE